MIRVLVADDQAAVRGGFAALIDAQDEMPVAGVDGPLLPVLTAPAAV